MRPRELILGTVIAGLIALVLVVFIRGYWVDWAWTGFGGRPVDEKYQEPRSLWDWLGLLIVPLVLAAGGLLFSRAERRNDREIANRRNEEERRRAEERTEEDRKRADERAQVDRELAADGLRQAALQDYLDRMSDLLLKEELGASQPGDPVRNVARARTLTVLNRLESDGKRKGSVVQFLYEAELIKLPAPVVDLRDANLRDAALSFAILSRSALNEVNLMNAELVGAILDGASLDRANLDRANLMWASLEGANLVGASLVGASLEGANLEGANLDGAWLVRADLMDAGLVRANLTNATVSQDKLADAWSLRGATLPNGDKHPQDVDNIFKNQKQT